jgi:pyruvate/2-oxoglutarate dehydrogenase complex dihydrolipoamide dehydrogenase (E3) component
VWSSRSPGSGRRAARCGVAKHPGRLRVELATLLEASGRVIGVGIVGPYAGELVAEIAHAMEMGADAADLALTIHPHPMLPETVGLATEAFEGTITDLYLPKKM